MNYGVIVGRFQVPELHQGHKALISHVTKKCDQILCFVAVSRTNSTKRNPMDFETRRLMLIPNLPPNTIILPIFDEKSNELWSKSLDQKINSIIGRNYLIKLYSGHYGFVKDYTGIFPVEYYTAPGTLTGPVAPTGTLSRVNATHRPQNSHDFRSGVIYGVSNQLSRPYMTVDCAILYDLGGVTAQILLGRKPKDTISTTSRQTSSAESSVNRFVSARARS